MTLRRNLSRMLEEALKARGRKFAEKGRPDIANSSGWGRRRGGAEARSVRGVFRRAARPWWLVAMMLTMAGSADRGFCSFDLSGPRIEARVARGNKSLPISEVPNLQEGDRLWLHPNFPEMQSVHYLLVVAFLRGPTDPPPDDWFISAETWSKHVQEEGVSVTVPQHATQVLLFLAPTTGGDLRTLRHAVQGQPGAFVRAAEELNLASLDRLRLDKYLAVIKETSDADPKALQHNSETLARTLHLKIDQHCFDRPAEQQASCLMDDSGDAVLNDGHGQSLIAALTSGPTGSLLQDVSATPMGGNGSYTSYVGVFFDLAKLMDSLRTADYRYIPALGIPGPDGLDLKLNTPPSFHNPKSVLVSALEPVGPARLPPLRAIDAHGVNCLQQSSLLLPVEASPLVFASAYAHDFSLHLQTKSGTGIDLPATTDPARGGFVVDTAKLRPDELGEEATGTLRGLWGYDSFAGPTFEFRSAHPASWTIAGSNEKPLVIGRDDSISLQSTQACCVSQVLVRDAQGKELNSKWKLASPDKIEVTVSLADAKPGPAVLLISQPGVSTPDSVILTAYAQAARLDSFTIHEGDREGVLKGTRLDEVAGLELSGAHMFPSGLSHEGDEDALDLSAPEGLTLHATENLKASVALTDGRALEVPVAVEPRRPSVKLMSTSVKADPAAGELVHLGSEDELAQNTLLTFVLKSETPAMFPRKEKIEVATADGSADALLSLADGSLILQDPGTVLAVLDPLKAIGRSAFGPLRLRPVDPKAGDGDWVPLGKLVRIPQLKDLRCPDSPEAQCTLEGTDLFLIESVASDPQFLDSVSVPSGFLGTALSVPRPSGTQLYLKLRDDPSTVSTAVLPLVPDSP